MNNRDLLRELAARVDRSTLPPDVALALRKYEAKNTPCAFCGKLSTHLCDFILGMQIGGWSGGTMIDAAKAHRLHQFVPGKGLPYYEAGDGLEAFTCDAPLCLDCRRNGGFTSGFHNPQQIDHCPYHDKKSEDVNPITPEAAELLRIKIWKRGKVVG
jgi:hypothetical protein